MKEVRSRSHARHGGYKVRADSETSEHSRRHRHEFRERYEANGSYVRRDGHRATSRSARPNGKSVECAGLDLRSPLSLGPVSLHKRYNKPGEEDETSLKASSAGGQ